MQRSAEEFRRRWRRRLANKSEETRRRRRQYRRRHNEKDGRLYYCDYCDLFISSAARSWGQHRESIRHMTAVEDYYKMLEVREPTWLASIRADIARAELVEHVRQQQHILGKGTTVLLPEMPIACIGEERIIIGGIGKQQIEQPPTPPLVIPQEKEKEKELLQELNRQREVLGHNTTTTTTNNNNNNNNGSSGEVKNNNDWCELPSIRVGGLLVAAATTPVVKVGGNIVTLPQGSNKDTVT